MPLSLRSWGLFDHPLGQLVSPPHLGWPQGETEVVVGLDLTSRRLGLVWQIPVYCFPFVSLDLNSYSIWRPGLHGSDQL